MTLTPWDKTTLSRALLTALGAWVVCVLIVAATDEGGVSLAARLGRSLPALPLAAAVGVALPLSGARARGELRALAAIGVSDARGTRAAVVGAALPGLACAVAVLAAALDVTSFFPRPDSKRAALLVVGDAFVDTERGLRIAPDGSFSSVSASAAREATSLPSGAHLATAMTIALASLAFAFVASLTPGVRRRRAIAALAASGAASIAFFQLAAAGHAPALLAAVPQAAMIAVLRVRYLDAQ